VGQTVTWYVSRALFRCFFLIQLSDHAEVTGRRNFGANARANQAHCMHHVLVHRALVFARGVREFQIFSKMFICSFISRFSKLKPLSVHQAWSGVHCYANKRMIYHDFRYSEILVFQLQTLSDDRRDDRHARHVNKTS
jgi:hypothetical protein